MFEGKAYLQYHTAWIIAKCDDQLVDYYRWWYYKIHHIKLMRPKFGAHISIVRGEEENITQGNWERNMNGREIKFYYSNDIVDVYNYVWMPVWGEDLDVVRKEVGLGKPIKSYHMTVGRTE